MCSSAIFKKPKVPAAPSIPAPVITPEAPPPTSSPLKIKSKKKNPKKRRAAGRSSLRINRADSTASASRGSGLNIPK